MYEQLQTQACCHANGARVARAIHLRRDFGEQGTNGAVGTRATLLRQGYGVPSIDGKAPKAFGASELGSDRVSNEREHMSQF